MYLHMFTVGVKDPGTQLATVASLLLAAWMVTSTWLSGLVCDRTGRPAARTMRHARCGWPVPVHAIGTAAGDVPRCPRCGGAM